MLKKLSNLFSDPKLKTIISVMGIATVCTLGGSLYAFISNPGAYTTFFQIALLGGGPQLLVNGLLGGGFLIKEYFYQKTEMKPQSELEVEPDMEPTSEVESEQEPEITAEIEPSKNLELEQNKFDEEPQELPNLNLNLEPKGVEFEFVSKPGSEEVNPEEPEMDDNVLKTETENQDINISEIKLVENDPLSDQPEELKINEQKEIENSEKAQIEHETQQLEFMKVRKNLKKVNPANLAQSTVKPEPKSILKLTEEMDSSSSESSTKKVQFAVPLANVINIKTVPETEEPVDVEFTEVTHQKDKKDELDVVPVKVKIEPVEEQAVVFLPQHDAQRAKTRERRAQINIQRNHNQADVLPEGTTRTRHKVDRFSGSSRR